MNVCGSRVRDRREQIGMTQSELAERLGYTSRSTIAKIESGDNDLNATKIVRFAAVLDTTPEYLIGRTDIPDNLPVDAIDYIENERHADIHGFVRSLNDADAERLRQLIRLTFGAEVL